MIIKINAERMSSTGVTADGVRYGTSTSVYRFIEENYEAARKSQRHSMHKTPIQIKNKRDCMWWDLLRNNCQYRNAYGKCVNRSGPLGYKKCESQGCPLLRGQIPPKTT